jgi:hypothetical protein
MLYLVTGDRVGGEPVKVDNDRIVWRNAAVGELAVPLSQVAAFGKAAGAGAAAVPVPRRRRRLTWPPSERRTSCSSPTATPCAAW